MKKLFILLGVLICSNLYSQTAPSIYWQFNNPNPLTPTVGGVGNNINFTGPYTINTGGPVGQYLTEPINGNFTQAGSIAASSAISIQFLMRPGRDFQQVRNATPISVGSTSISFAYPNIIISTSTGAGVQTYINMAQVGKASWATFNDGNWHHIALTFNASSGSISLYIDGQNPAYFTRSVPAGTIFGGPQAIYFSTTVDYTSYAGDLDEIAIYPNVTLTANQIYKNYQDYLGGQHYTTALAATVPPPAPTTAGYDPNQYVPGYPAPTILPQNQIAFYPKPRYRPIANGSDSLLTLLTYADPIYLGGQGSTYSTGPTYNALNGCEIYMQMAKDFNFALNSWAYSDGSFAGDTNVLLGKMIKRANANPKYKLQAITYFSDAPNYGYLPSNYGNQGYPAFNYVQNSGGNFYNSYCAQHACSGGIYAVSDEGPYVKVARPSISQAQSANGSHFNDATLLPGVTWHFNSASLYNAALTRPLDFSLENGELYLRYQDIAMSGDPIIAADMATSGFNSITTQSIWRARNEIAYRNGIYGTGTLANMTTTKYAEYQLQGNVDFFHQWEQMRLVNFSWRGMRLSTSDFYVRGPHYWYHGDYNAFHGFRWFMTNDSSEQANGDRLQCPFVSAGWAQNEYANTSPAQYLGEMKVFGVRGAESYYSSTFPGTDATIPDPRAYIWGIIAPSYAHAISSRIERIMHRGYLMVGDVPYDNTKLSGRKACQFNTGYFHSYCVVRKDSTMLKYAIGANLNRNSNMIGNCPDTNISTITLNGENLTFTVRQQGSVYVYDNTNPANKVFYQLDKWHEKTHPYYWSQDFEFEAEVNDNYADAQLKTTRRSGAPAGDFVNATTYISYADTTTILDTVRFNFTPRVASTYYVWVRMKSRTGVATGVTFKLNGGTTYTLPVTNTSWYWYRFDNGVVAGPGINYSLTTADQHLGILPINKYVEIDQIVFTKTPNAGYPEPPVGCTTPSNITPSGATTFCTGGSVTLTATPAASYLWSTGATTSAISVSVSGTFTVTVTDGGGCTGVSSGTVVTVNTVPVTPIITASGSTSICSGSSVTLTSTASTSYLWSTGATTISISPTTAATYTVTITNAGGCTASSAGTTVTVNALPGVPTITPTGATTFCNGSSVLLTATASTAYLWSTGVTTQTISPTTAGTYTVTVYNAAGCTRSSAGTTVTVNPNPILGSIAPQQNTCPAVTFDLSTIVLVNTGAAGTSAYYPTQADAIAQTGAIGAVVAATGVYWIRVTAGTGCYDYKSVSVTIVSCLCASPPIAAAGGDQSICAGATSTMAGSITNATVGTWTTSGTGTFTSSTSLTAVYTPSVADIAAGFVDITLTTDNPLGAPCVAATDIMKLTINALPTPVISAGGSTTICSGSSVVLASTLASSYLWSTGATTQTISVSTGAIYNCTVTNSAGCTAVSNSITITVNGIPTTPTISASGPLTFCTGGSVVLTSSGSTSYLWSTGATTQAITASAQGNYIVTVTNAGGCTASSAFTQVLVNPIPATPTILPPSPITLCSGNSATLTSSNSVSYVWSTGATTQSISASTAGLYRVTVAVNGCTAISAATTVNVNTAATANILPSGNVTSCNGASVTLTVSANSSYLWSTGATTQSISASANGAYSCIVTNASGCTANSNVVNVSIIPAITATITLNTNDTVCGGGASMSANAGYFYLWSNGATTQTVVVNVTGNYTVRITNTSGCTAVSAAQLIVVLPGGTQPVITPDTAQICTGQSVVLASSSGTSYLWSTGETTQSINTTFIGSYTVTVSNGSGCSAVSDPAIITGGTSLVPVITISGGGSIFCQGTSRTLTCNAATGYLWSTGGVSSSISATVGGTYTVTVTDAYGCTASATTSLIMKASPATPTITTSGPQVICTNGRVTFTSSSSASYLWSNGATTAQVIIRSAGTYRVTVSNTSGCTASSAPKSVTVNGACYDSCKVVTGVGVKNIRVLPATGGQRYCTATIYWDQSNNNSTYKVYVVNTATNATRSGTYSGDIRETIYNDLLPNKTFKTYVIGTCSGTKMDTSGVVYFKTPKP